jgi:hypothetical protein
MMTQKASKPQAPFGRLTPRSRFGFLAGRRSKFLGCGEGYHDRLLAHPCRAPTLGARYQGLLIDEIPHDAHDPPVDYLATEDLVVLACRATYEGPCSSPGSIGNPSSPVRLDSSINKLCSAEG